MHKLKIYCPGFFIPGDGLFAHRKNFGHQVSMIQGSGNLECFSILSLKLFWM